MDAVVELPLQPCPSSGSYFRRADHDNRSAAEAVYSFKLLEALRKGDQTALHPFLTSLPSLGTVKAAGPSGDGRVPNVKELTSPLHLAVRCAELSTVQLCLEYKNIDVNAVEAQGGNTPLHLAACIGRLDVVELLISQEDVDDTIRNAEGREPIELAKTPEIAQVIQVSRAELNMYFLELLESYSKDAPGAEGKLFALLDRPRVRVLDLNAQAPESGTTLLNEAARRKDTHMIETAVRKGADVFSRDRRGKRALDSAKDERVKALLRQFSNADAALQSQAAPGQPPSFKGYMSKWTNMATGYKTRWFVLENGVLSYFHSQEDEGKQSRGSINMRFATVLADGNDKHRLEIISTAGGKASKLYMRGSHPVERARWVQVLQQTVEFFKLDRNPSRPESIYSYRLGSTDALSQLASASSPNLLAGTGTTRMSRAGSLLGASIHGSLTPARSGDSRAQSFNNKTPSIISRDSRTPSDEPEILQDSESTAGSSRPGSLPHDSEFALVANSLRTQIDMSQQLLESMSGAPANGLAAQGMRSGASQASDRRSVGLSSQRLSKDSSRSGFASSPEGLRDALRDALKSTAILVNKYQQMVGEREAYLLKRYEQEIQAKHLWEENMKTLAQQHAEMEAALHEASRDNARKRRALREVRSTLASSPGSVGSPVPAVVSPPPSAALATPTLPASSSRDDVYATPPSSLAMRRVGDPSPSAVSALRLVDPLPSAAVADPATAVNNLANAELERESMDDADDQFFDAIETGNLPGLKVETPLEKPPVEEDWPSDFNRSVIDERSVAPYRHLRSQLPIGKDDRPAVSLWAILKTNIGKDLTKISFPVSFNEPTSMLQRMAEDMEFTECLDAAAMQTDSTKRIAYVAAFAMSNYSSTIGRIAKPFNPLLGETFEYARLDKHYRYVSEQVSHHPPISACYAESPQWEYMGCVDAKSKFLGRTFEIRPTGVAHANLKIPEEWAPPGKRLPTAQTSKRVLEHYSWNKVTTSVSGFIVGSPTIDHFGDMEIVNHATGDKCVLTFKPRGWRGKDAYEIRGVVYDSRGNVAWDIAGRWNSQLVARKVGAGHGDLNPDQTVATPIDAIAAPQQPTAEYLLLWKNSEKPPAPFNLTPFAITLNSMPPDLRPWLAPTDCRLRPDQRAFESGKYDRANELKSALEDLQRNTRRKREAGQLPEHKPRWFRRTMDEDTRETFWEPSMVPRKDGQTKEMEYWAERERVGSVAIQGQPIEWKGVSHIFGDFEVAQGDS